MGSDRPIKVAVQIDSQEPQTVAFIPDAPPGQLPAQWDGNDGFVANAAVDVVTNWPLPPGAHTLKVRKRSAKPSSLSLKWMFY